MSWEKMHPVIRYTLFEQYNQARAIWVIGIYLILFIAVFFQRVFGNVPETLVGLVAAAVGLAFFLIGLKGSVMPIAERVGMTIHSKFPVPVVLLITFILGSLTSFAEPAVASLSPLADSISRQESPYLWWMLKYGDALMVLAIGSGVGSAAVLGMLRFMYGFRLRTCVMTIISIGYALTLILQFALDEKGISVLAWDAGPSATGPVTVPILLAIGVGSVTYRQATGKPVFGDQELAGLGLVSLAVTCPIITVQLYGLMIIAYYDRDTILAMSATTDLPASEKSPVKEVVYSFRAMLPLVGMLMIVLLLLLRERLPIVTIEALTGFAPPPPATPGSPTLPRAMIREVTATDALAAVADEDAKEKEEDKKTVVELVRREDFFKLPKRAISEPPNGIHHTPHRRLPPMRRLSDNDIIAEEIDRARSDDVLLPMSEHDAGFRDDFEENPVTLHTTPDTADAAPASPRVVAVVVSPAAQSSQTSASDVQQNAASHGVVARIRDFFYTNRVLLLCLLSTQVGLIIFNWGLTYGFTYIGTETGNLLPAVYKDIDGESKSPLLPQGIGLALVLLYVIGLGIVAAKAEPGLNVMAAECKKLTKGLLKRKVVTLSVACGFAIGLAIGVARLNFRNNFIWYILPAYCISFSLSRFVPESVMSIGWDCGGAVTGPVVVPFVLLIGLAFANGLHLNHGFGVIGVASCCVGICVMSFSLVQKYKSTRRPAVVIEH